MVGFEGEARIDSLLAITPVPQNFELLSIDIDSYDWQLWNAQEKYRPKTVIIESNCVIPPGISQIQNPPASSGASFTALVRPQPNSYFLLAGTEAGASQFLEASLAAWGKNRCQR